MFKIDASKWGATGLILMLVFIVAVAVIGPFLAIWSVNTLFSLTIPYSLETWSATILLGMFLRGDGLSFNSKK